MLAFNILTAHFWEFLLKIALWDCCQHALIKERDCEPYYYQVIRYFCLCFSFYIQAVMGNGPSCQAGIPDGLIKSGGDLADPCALSTITREVCV